jgi:signal transduction histidine kinase
LRGVSGFDLLAQLRAESATRDIPVVLIASGLDREHVRQGMTLGADDFLTKPFTREEVITCVEARLQAARLRLRPQTPNLQDAKELLSNVIAHEFRTPLTVMIGAHDLLTDYLKDSSDAHLNKLLELAISQTRRLRHKVDQALLYVRIESGQIDKRTVTYHSGAARASMLIQAAVDLVANSTQSNAERRVHIQPGHDIIIYGEIQLLTYALAELIDNALKFSPTDSDVLVSHGENEEQVWVKITDRGRGFPQELLSEAFEPYSQLNRGQYEQQGLGLGLAISKRIVEMHSGALRIYSSDTLGTVSLVSLPRRRSET